MTILIIPMLVLATMLLSWGYFRRYSLARPPLGVINLTDIIFMMVGIILVPYLEIIAPNWLIVSLLGLGTLVLVQMTLAPVLPAGWVVWFVAFVLIMADGGSAWRFGTPSLTHQALNNTVMLIIVVGITNLWVQSGMRARDTALLGAMLTLYDFVFTTRLTLMADLFQRLAGIPFAQQLAWPVSGNTALNSIGLGDLLFVAVFPLAMHKAFGRVAASIAFALGFTACAGLDLTLWLTDAHGIFPIMVILGPLMVAQYLFWIQRNRRERTTLVFLAAEPQHRTSL